MKTASKLLSMLLLVAMCLSLMGGSAYALSLEPVGSELALDLPAEGSSAVPEESGTFDLKLGGSEAVPEGSTTLELEKPGLYTGTKNIWNGLYEDLNTAAQNTTDIKLHDKADSSVTDPGGTISRSVTIDLNDKTLTFTAPLAVNANITIMNGTLSNANMITVGKGYTITLTNVFKTGEIGGAGESTVTEDYIATIGSEKFATMDEAFAYAAKQPGTVTINVIDDPSKLEDYSFSELPAMSCSSVVLNLGNNCLKGILDAYVPFTINGGTIEGSIFVYSDVVLNNTEVIGIVDVYGKKLTMNNSTVENVGLVGGTLVMGSGSAIGKLVVNDDDAGQSVLDVRGGEVGMFVLYSEDENPAYRAITGGEWNVGVDPETGKEDVRSLNYLRNCVKDGLTLKGTKNPYTVGSGSGNGDSGVVTGDFTVYGSPYTKGSNGTVYVLMPYTSSTGSYYWTTVRNPGYSDIKTIPSDCKVTSSGTQYKLNLTNSFLDGLSSGTIYLWTGHDGKYTYMGSLTINGSGTIVNPGDAAIWPVDSSEWYSGNGMYYFYVTPALQLVEGSTYDYYDVCIDGVLIGGDKLAYSGYQKFGVASSVMDSLSIGTHTITVLTTAGYASCNFRVGATLRPVDTDKHVTGSSKNLQFVCSDSIKYVWVGGRQLTEADYGDYWTLSASGKTVTLTAKFLNNRTAGETYTIGVQTESGDKPSCTFQILTRAQASSSPQTGDESNLALWAAVLILSGGAAVAVLPRLKKHED